MSSSGDFEIGVLAGDGIGPELSTATCEVLREATRLSGLRARETFGNLLPDETMEVLRKADAWIMGPIFAGEYPKDDHTKGHPIGYLRRTFNL